MTWIISFFEKLFGIRKVLAIAYISSRILWIVSLISFVGFASYAVFNLWDFIIDIFTTVTSGFGAKELGGNNITALIEGGLNSMGFYEVMNVYLPFYLSSLSFFLGYSMFKTVMKAKDKVLTEFRKSAGLYLG